MHTTQTNTYAELSAGDVLKAALARPKLLRPLLMRCGGALRLFVRGSGREGGRPALGSGAVWVCLVRGVAAGARRRRRLGGGAKRPLFSSPLARARAF